MRRLAPPIALVAILAIVALAGCGGGERIAETREVAPYDRLEVSDSVDVRSSPATAARCASPPAST